MLGLEKIENRLYRNDIFLGSRNQSAQRDVTACIEGDNVIGHLVSRLEIEDSLNRADLDHFVLDEGGSTVLGHLLYMETDILGTINSGEQPWSHAGIVVIGRRADESDPVAALNVVGKVRKNG